MIFINLLPHREEARKRKREAFKVLMALAAICGCLVSGVIFLWFEAQLSEQQDVVTILQQENLRLDGQIKDIAGLKEEIAALRARQQAVEDLQSDRNLPVHMLTELWGQLPDGVYLTSVKQENQTLTLAGMAQSNDRISEYLFNLGNNSKWLTSPELIDFVADNVNLTPKDTRRVAKFNIRVKLVRSSDAEKVLRQAGAASGPVAGASAAASAAKPVGLPAIAPGAASSAAPVASKPLGLVPNAPVTAPSAPKLPGASSAPVGSAKS